eukprot:scaffold374_cov108-Isochrysis_galbana.AAC.7
MRLGAAAAWPQTPLPRCLRKEWIEAQARVHDHSRSAALPPHPSLSWVLPGPAAPAPPEKRWHSSWPASAPAVPEPARHTPQAAAAPHHRPHLATSLPAAHRRYPR